MDNSLIERQTAVVETRRANYAIISPFANADGSKNEVILKRDLDFGVIPKTPRPTLFKSGAERVCQAYGVFARYERKSAIEEIQPEPFFYYSYECRLVKIGANGQEYVLANGYGNANTKEAGNGLNSAFNAANNAEKKAQKRALVAAAISLGGLSSMFYADLDDSSFVNKGYDEIKLTADDNAPVTAKQIKRLYAIGNEAGKNVQDIKTLLAARGYTSTKDIKQSEYDELCKLVGGENVKGQEENADTKKDTGN